jgi:hypothetical protein
MAVRRRNSSNQFKRHRRQLRLLPTRLGRVTATSAARSLFDLAMS